MPASRNNAVSRLAVRHMSGDDILVLASGEGARFGDPTVDAPIRVTVAARSTLVNGQIAPTSTQTIFDVTTRADDTLSGLTAVEGTSDQNFGRNDPVAAMITWGMIEEIQDTVGTVTTAPTGLLKGSSGLLAVATPSTDYSVPSANETIAGVKTHVEDLVISEKKLKADHPALDTFGASCLAFDPGTAPAMQVGGQIVADGGGGEDRPHFVWGMGTNLAGANRQIDPLQTMCRYAMEHNYWNSAGIAGGAPEYSHEFHLPAILPPASSGLGEIRPLSIVYGDTSHKAAANFAVSQLSISDETATLDKGSWRFTTTTTSYTLYHNVGGGAPVGTLINYGASATADTHSFGRGTVSTTAILDGTQVTEKLNLSGVTKYTRSVDSGNGGQMTRYGPLSSQLELEWTASGVNQRWISQRLKVGGFGTATAQVQVIPDAVGTIGRSVKALASQTADLDQAVDSAGVVRVRINKNANLIVKRNTAPADADLGAGEFSLWLDDTIGTTVLKIKAKDSAGTVRTGSVALS